MGGVGECEWCVGAVLTAYTTLRIRHETFTGSSIVILTRCETRVFPQSRCTCIASVTSRYSVSVCICITLHCTHTVLPAASRPSNNLSVTDHYRNSHTRAKYNHTQRYRPACENFYTPAIYNFCTESFTQCVLITPAV